ncbi:MAG: zinc ribbon domain-containing protein [Planctomycetota bacterium]|nr:zinc ribbon domain-containing protein [Planctomycetota bacterium]
MPTYDYVCNACEHAFELFQQMSAPVKKKCPECGKLKLQRLIGTGSAVLFKGGGFYETDYRSESYKKGKEAETKSKDDKKSDKKTSDSKTEKKSDSAAGKKSAKASKSKEK